MHDLDVAVAARLEQRGYAVMVRGVNRGSRGQQRLGHFRVGVKGRPQERSGAVVGGRIYIRVLLDQFANRRQIVGLGGVSHDGYVGSCMQKGVGSHATQPEAREAGATIVR